MNHLSNKNINSYLKLLPLILICLGIFLRLFAYMYNRSLWLDEVLLANNIANSSFIDFLKPQYLNAGEAPGFLIIEKIAVIIFGNNEYSLRLFPLIFGITSIFIFKNIARKTLNFNAYIIATGLFVLNKYLIYYSTEAKKYSIEVFTTLFLLMILVEYHNYSNFKIKNILVYALTGAICIWFSNVSIIVLIGVAVSLLIIDYNRNSFNGMKNLAFIFSVWALSFAIYYIIFLSHQMDILSSHLALDFKSKLMPFPPTTFSDVRWYISTFFAIFNNPGGFHLTGLAALTFIVGSYVMLTENKDKALILISPIIITIIVSGLHKYPIWERTCLFWVPIMIILMASGAETIRFLTFKNKKVIGVTLLILLFIMPSLSATYALIRPVNIVDMKAALSYIKNKRQDNDMIYIHSNSIAPFKYYQKRYNIDENNVILGKTEVVNFMNDLKVISKSNRVWIVLGMLDDRDEAFILSAVETKGKKLDSFKIEGTQGMPVSHLCGNISAYLYKFNNN